MVFLLATALSSGFLTAIALAPISKLAAVMVTPLVASVATGLAGAIIAYRSEADNVVTFDLDAQTDAMVEALRGVAHQAHPSATASTAPEKTHKAA
jgi:hypothetical protein